MIFMKKSLWGYDPQEVDETVEYLETSNARLEKQVRQLNSELEELRLKSESPAREQNGEAQDSEKTGQLEARCIQLEAENERLKADMAALSMQMGAEASGRDELEQASEICRAAYQDMAQARQKAKEKLEEFTCGFLDKWNDYQQKISALTEEVQRTQEESREAFLIAADGILEKYATIGQESETLQGCIGGLEEAHNGIRSQIDELLASMDTGEQEAPDALEDSCERQPQEEEPKHAVLRALQERSKEQPAPSGPMEVTAPSDGKKVSALPGRETAQQNDEIGIAIGVNTRNIVNN